MKNLGLFQEENKPKKKIILHRKNPTNSPSSEKIILHRKKESPCNDQIQILLNSTTNRMYRTNKLHLEIEEVSKQLNKLSKKQNRKIESIVGYASALLKAMPNIYIKQALEFLEQEESWSMLQINKTKMKGKTCQ